ncbi:MAG: ABC transporter permease [Flammeovirgaceae bacterium]|nr:ABC transporter permease [Flammeovirgaceae bacterium]
MIRNYIKVALRAIFRNKLTAFINIAGLAFAMVSALMIFLYIQDELGYDTYHSKADRIYRVTRDFLSPDGSVSLHLGHVAPPFGPLLKNDFPDFEEVVRTLQVRSLVAYQQNAEEAKSFNIENMFYAEPGIFNVFDVDVKEGNPQKLLYDPFTALLSAETAKKYFGEESAVGKRLRFGNTYDVEVSGVFEDFPNQSHWHPEILLAFSTLNDSTIYGARRLETNWGNNSFSTYALVKEPFDVAKTEAQFPAFLDKHMGGAAASNNMPLPSTFTHIYLQKMTDIHLYSHLDSEVETNGNITNVYMMGTIGLFIILIACFNFVNLSTARATKRAKEVGMRKVAGAFKNQLITQYLSESVLIALLGLIIAIALSVFAVRWLNTFTGKALELNLITDWPLTLGLIGFAIFVGALAGIYPAFVISGFKPAGILKGQQGSATGKGGIRKTLVVFQFAISITLIIATAITFQQLSYLNDRDLGYEKDQVINTRFFSDLAPNYDAFYNELLKHSSIKNVSRSSRIPTGRLLDSQGTAQVQKGDSMEAANVVIKNIRSDHEFFDTYAIPFASGRNFSKEIKSDDSLGFVLNEAAVNMLGLTNEEILTRDFQYGGVKGRVIGVVSDFHFESLHEEITPMVFQPSQFYNRLSVKIAGSDMQQGIAQLEKVWKQFIPHRPFEYDFLSEQYRQLYEAEQKQGQLFTIFSGLAIIIACLGLFGLATFNTLQRVKEIGIRKVLGASVTHILALLSKEIIMLVVIANIIAWPIAWYFMNEWLDGFAYRINLNAGIFVVATLIALLIALITISSQTIKAATSNPANTLRYE